MMTKKIYFLLTFLLTTIGGGNLFAADETFSVSGDTGGSPQTINGTNWDSEDVTLSSATASVGLTIGGGSNYWNLASDKITGKNSSASLTFQADKNGLLVINLTKNSGGNKYLTIKRNGSEQEVKSVDVNGTTISYNSSQHGYNIEPASCSIVVNIDAEAGVSYTIDFSASNFKDWSFSSFTFDLETIDKIYTATSGAYSYTWDFTVEDVKWTKSKSQMSTLGWTFEDTDAPTDGVDDQAHPSTNPSGATYEIDIIKGLTFTTASGYPDRLKLDWKNKKMSLNGFVTIPNVKVGQTIIFESTANVFSNEYGSARVSPNLGYAKVFTVTTEGNAQFTVNCDISSIQVKKSSQTLAFGQASYTVDYGATEVSHIPTLSPATGATITYSSSDPSVATVNESTGELTTVNSGTCIITATAAETETYDEATASYTLTVNGTQNPTLAWSSSNGFTYSGGDYTAADLQYGNHQTYTAYVSNHDGSNVTNSAIRYGLVEGYEGYLTIDDKKGLIAPTRKFADEDLDYKEVEVYAQIPASGPRNAARITYKVKIVKGLLADDFFKENELYVNVNHTIAPKNNLQSMRWEDIDAITVTLKTGESSTAVPGTGESTVTNYKLATPKATYFDTKTATSGDDNGKEIVDWFYPIFKGLAVGTVIYTVTMSSSLYGDLSGDITLHVLEEETTTGFAWAEGTQEEYTIYEGDYMLLPEITGNTNGNFSYSSGYDNQNTHHKYVYTRRWDGSQYVTTYNNKNFHKGEGFPNFDLTSDAEGNTAVTEVQADGSNVALLFWNTGTGTEHDQLLIYGNKAGTVYLKAFDPQITSRALSTIKIVVKSKTAINEDFENLKSNMTFPYTWDFTTNYDWSTEIETGTGNWKLNGSSYDLDMSSNINYDYADEDKNRIVWGNDNNDPNTNSSELTSKLFVGQGNKVLRGFAGMKIRLGNNGTGSWYSKRDGIHILPYTSSNTPRLRVTTGTHTLILPTPTGSSCPETFKVFVKAKALETGEGTLWVRNADLARDASGQNSYYDFKSASLGDVIIYSVNATKDTPLELDLDKVDIYWIAYSTEAKNLAKPGETTTYYASTYSYPKGLDIIKSEEANPKITAYFAGDFNSSDAVTMYQIDNNQGEVPSNTGMLLKATTDPATNPGSLYMIAAAENINGEKSISGLSTNYLKANLTAGSVMPTTGENTNFVLTYRYKRVHVDGTVDSDYTNGDWSFYRPVPTGATIGANAAYLQVPGDLYVMSAASRRAGSDDDNRPAAKQLINIIFDDDPSGNTGTTEINDISNNVGIGSDAWYTLQGVRVEAPTKGGIYIHNGRKVVIK